MGVNTWWNNQWKARRTIKTTVGSPHTSGIHFVRVDADLDELISDGRLRSDYADLRIVCQKLDHDINIPYYIAENPFPKRIFFAAQHDIPEDANIGTGSTERYYIYYDNPSTYNTLQPDTYLNINFPQAPYSVHTTGYDDVNGTYFDRHFFRLNDDPADGPELFADATGRPSGLSRHHTHVQKGHSGVLDQSVFFDGTYANWNPESGSWIHIPGDFTDIAVPSGSWAVDFWVKIHPKSDLASHNGTLFSHALGSGAEFDDPYPLVYQTFSNSTNIAFTYMECNFSYQQSLLQRESAISRIPSGEWHHFRVAYRTGGGHNHSRIHMYLDGRWADLYPYNLSSESQAYAENTAFLSKYDTAPSYIGWRYRMDDGLNDMFTGWVEQMRYSSFVFPGISGTADAADPYHCAPDWVGVQYTGILGPLSTELGSSGDIGGVLLSVEIDSASGQFGGAVLGRRQAIASVGGMMFAISDRASGDMGGFLWSVVETSGSMGGIALGSYGDIEVNTVEGLKRVLIKADSDAVGNQIFRSDASLALYGSSQDNFDAVIQTETGSAEEVDALLTVSKIRFNPSVVITDIDTTYSGVIPATCTITASGHAYDVNNNQIASGIHYVAVIWGDNDFTEIETPRASGYVWSATHIYSHSGLYKPVVFVRDKYGRVGSDDDILNLASGVEVPYVSLSGQPRSGYVPPLLEVDCEAAVSGTLGSYTLYWDFGNGISFFNNSPTQTTQYAMPGDYSPWIRLEDERGIYVMDTLRIGYNT